MDEHFIESVTHTIDAYGMLSPHDHLLIALSGGADSTALLVAMAEIAPKYDLRLSAAHVNHGIRGAEAERDARHAETTTEEVAKRYGIEIPFYLRAVDVKKLAKEKKLSTQEAGRLARDVFFRELMKTIGATKIATGHTASDNAETFLMRLVTGAGPEGLSGIPPVRLPYIRPLIDVTRAEVEAFLTEQGIAWITDSTNLKSDYLRNRVRNEVMPMLKSINPNIERTLIETVAGYRERFALLKSAADVLVEKNFPDNPHSVAELASLPPDLRSEVVKLLIFREARETSRPVRLLRAHIEAVVDLITSPSDGQKHVPLPGGLVASRTYEALTIAPQRGPTRHRQATKQDERVIPLPQSGSVIFPLLDIVITAEVIRTDPPEGGAKSCAPDALLTGSGNTDRSACFDLDTIPGPLFVRTRRIGDRIHPAGGGTRKLSDFFIDNKVPRDERDKVPLLVLSDDVIWIVGMRQDERFSVTPETKRILRVTCERLRA